MNDRAVIRALLDKYRHDDPTGVTAGVLWWVANLMWRAGDPVLPEPLPAGRADAA